MSRLLALIMILWALPTPSAGPPPVEVASCVSGLAADVCGTPTSPIGSIDRAEHAPSSHRPGVPHGHPQAFEEAESETELAEDEIIAYLAIIPPASAGVALVRAGRVDLLARNLPNRLPQLPIWRC